MLTYHLKDFVFDILLQKFMVHQYSNIIVILLLSQSNCFEILLSTNVVYLPYKEYARHYKYGRFLALKILIKDESFENFVLRRKTLDQNFQSQKSTIIYCCFYYVCISNMIIICLNILIYIEYQQLQGWERHYCFIASTLIMRPSQLPLLLLFLWVTS
jgi:hypothetical protein